MMQLFQPAAKDQTTDKLTFEDRFPEKIKFLPVGFVVLIILGLYLIYTQCHLAPLLKADAPNAGVEAVVFHLITGMLVFCYLLCIFVHPGTIPDKSEDASWEYVGETQPQQPLATDASAMNMQEAKRSGDRRFCKWCQQYKPDRCHHCRVCRKCILKMDHHCPWIYNCVGFRNYKYFFLLLLFTTIDCNFIVWTMLPSVRDGTDPRTPFFSMFCLLFGETLAGFLGVFVTLFFCFHIYLTLKAMTTIEFCEKSQRRVGGFSASVYDRGIVGNIKAVLGENPFTWFLPIGGPEGRGLSFVTEDMRLKKDMEVGRGMRRKAHDRATESAEPKRRSDRPQTVGGGTGSTNESDGGETSGSDAIDSGRETKADIGGSSPGGFAQEDPGASAPRASSGEMPVPSAATESSDLERGLYNVAWAKTALTDDNLRHDVCDKEFSAAVQDGSDKLSLDDAICLIDSICEKMNIKALGADETSRLAQLVDKDRRGALDLNGFRTLFRSVLEACVAEAEQ
eukprot:TRINITY_DN109002_c0_g1_i1.p1 TRINITY_DN109002_c0_g1~~TRINITY_DN109002_c0_g1_i1.p1  ORF type:complete len:509 (+),score=90.37 TRINITY_DN109002_c0_g1_i1:226-1752(+)